MPDGRPRYFLIQTLSNRTERDGVLRSHAGLAEAEAEERSEAIWALWKIWAWKIADPRTTDGLIALLASDDAYVGQLAALGLIRIGGEPARAALKKRRR